MKKQAVLLLGSKGALGSVISKKIAQYHIIKGFDSSDTGNFPVTSELLDAAKGYDVVAVVNAAVRHAWNPR
jgi:uncharacterized protein YgbK (DUF1537 family)